VNVWLAVTLDDVRRLPCLRRTVHRRNFLFPSGVFFAERTWSAFVSGPDTRRAPPNAGRFAIPPDTGGGFRNALGRLRTLELITGRDELAVAEAFFQ